MVLASSGELNIPAEGASPPRKRARLEDAAHDACATFASSPRALDDEHPLLEAAWALDPAQDGAEKNLEVLEAVKPEADPWDALAQLSKSRSLGNRQREGSC